MTRGWERHYPNSRAIEWNTGVSSFQAWSNMQIPDPFFFRPKTSHLLDALVGGISDLQNWSIRFCSGIPFPLLNTLPKQFNCYTYSSSCWWRTKQMVCAPFCTLFIGWFVPRVETIHQSLSSEWTKDRDCLYVKCCWFLVLKLLFCSVIHRLERYDPRIMYGTS